MSFRDNIKSDALDCFLNRDEFAEAISYLPNGVDPKAIKAVVARRRLSPAGEDNSRAIVNDFEIYISNDDVLGVESIRCGKDKVVLAQHEGGPNVECLVVEVLGSDAGMWHLSLRK